MQALIDGASNLGIKLSHAQLTQYQTYYDDLADWNSRMNLTAITDYREVQIKHFVDSISVVLALPELTLGACGVIDVGTGGGFPGIPLKIAFPQMRLTLLEATGKKSEFLRHVVQRLALDNVDVMCSRSEDAAHLPEYREQFDVAVTRGLAKMATLCELTIPFCKVGGKLIAQKKGDIIDELESAHKAITILGGQKAQIIPIAVPELNDQRCLIVVNKSSSTPAQYPRRSGTPAKKPLGKLELVTKPRGNYIIKQNTP